ncbi:MAG: 1-aminocyclopropane-1-carboxylate deaminase/D-cysteine desulfhydrase [Pseudohongiellaceae bacterium]
MRWQSEFQAAPVEQVNCELLTAKSLRLRVLRLDKIHPQVQGNKWFKLRLNLASCLEQGLSRVISFGGAYSNHLYALAAAGGQLGLETVGVVRGELVEPFNPVLAYCQSQGMKLHSVSRSEYRQKLDPLFLKELQDKYGPAFIVPEGGSNQLGVQGCEEIATHLCNIAGEGPVTIALACGTGTTLAGVIQGLGKQQANHAVLGVSVLKAEGYIERQTKSWLTEATFSGKQSWYVSDSFHCGGYAKSSMELIEFIERFKEVSDIPLEPVYTGKLFFGLFSMIEADAFPPGSDLIAVHSGGIIP